jgi:hypothetical protein
VTLLLVAVVIVIAILLIFARLWTNVTDASSHVQ